MSSPWTVDPSLALHMTTKAQQPDVSADTVVAATRLWRAAVARCT